MLKKNYFIKNILILLYLIEMLLDEMIEIPLDFPGKTCFTPVVYKIDTDKHTIIVSAIQKYICVAYNQFVNFCNRIEKSHPTSFAVLIQYDTAVGPAETVHALLTHNTKQLPMYSLSEQNHYIDIHEFKFQHESGTYILILVINEYSAPDYSMITAKLLNYQYCKYFGMVTYDPDIGSPETSYFHAKNNLETIPLLLNVIP